MIIANERLLVKCYDIKKVKLPGGLFYRGYHMQLTNKKKKKKDVEILKVVESKYLTRLDFA